MAAGQPQQSPDWGSDPGAPRNPRAGVRDHRRDVGKVGMHGGGGEVVWVRTGSCTDGGPFSSRSCFHQITDQQDSHQGWCFWMDSWHMNTWTPQSYRPSEGPASRSSFTFRIDPQMQHTLIRSFKFYFSICDISSWSDLFAADVVFFTGERPPVTRLASSNVEFLKEQMLQPPLDLSSYPWSILVKLQEQIQTAKAGGFPEYVTVFVASQARLQRAVSGEVWLRPRKQRWWPGNQDLFRQYCKDKEMSEDDDPFLLIRGFSERKDLLPAGFHDNLHPPRLLLWLCLKEEVQNLIYTFSQPVIVVYGFIFI